MPYCSCKTYFQSNFKLSDVYLDIFCRKLKHRKRELIIHGSKLLILKGRRLCDFDMVTICQWLSIHPDVVGIDLSYNRFTNEGARTLAHFLMNSNHVKRVNLMCNDIGDEGVQEFALLGNRLEVQSLRLNGNKIGEKGGEHIASLLETSTSLLHLDIAETEQTATSLAYIIGALHSDQNKKSNLKILDISRPLGYQSYKYDSHHAMETIGNMMKLNSCLTELHMQKMGVNCSDIPLLILGLKKNNTLILLDLQANYIGCDGAQALADWLATSPVLQGLMLGHNNINDLGAVALGHKLPYSKIKLLDLAHNGITAEGLLFLLDTMKKVVNLEILYIWGNRITNKVCRKIKRMLMSGVLVQDNLDVNVYKVDGVYHPALNTVDRYKHIYYCVGDYSYPQPLDIPTQVIHPMPLARKRIRGGQICAHAIKLLGEADSEKKLNGNNELSAVALNSACYSSIKSSIIFQEDNRKHLERTKELSIKYEEQCNVPSYLKQQKITQLLKDIKTKKQLAMKVNSKRDSQAYVKDKNNETATVQMNEETKNKQQQPKEHVKENSSDVVTNAVMIDTNKQHSQMQTIAVQTHFPRLWSQHFSFELRRAYPLTSYSVAEMELASRNNLDILDDVQEAYVRKYQQQNDLEREAYDLCYDVTYHINNSPLIITHSEEEAGPLQLEEEEEEKEEEEEILDSFEEAKSPTSEKEVEKSLSQIFSKYEILEHNIHNVSISMPLAKDAKEQSEPNGMSEILEMYINHKGNIDNEEAKLDNNVKLDVQTQT